MLEKTLLAVIQKCLAQLRIAVGEADFDELQAAGLIEIAQLALEPLLNQSAASDRAYAEARVRELDPDDRAYAEALLSAMKEIDPNFGQLKS